VILTTFPLHGQVSAGPLGVWGLDLKNEVYFRDGTFGDPEDSEGTGWTKVGEREKKAVKGTVQRD
jgi:hypothetical protein